MSGEAAFCPHCGYDLQADVPIESGPVSFDPRGLLAIGGVEVHLQPRSRIFLGTLLKAKGAWVARATLVDRIGLDTDQADLNASCVAKLTRQALRPFGLDTAVETQYGYGYRWRLLQDHLAPAPVQS